MNSGTRSMSSEGVSMRQSIRFSVFSAFLILLSAGFVSAQSVPNFADLAEEKASSVVRIEARTEASSERQDQMDRLQQQMPELYRYFFGDQMPFPQQPELPRERRS